MRSILCLFLLVASVHQAAADDWPHWRGPNRNDVVADHSGWENGHWLLEELWSTNVGEGGTSPIIVAGKVYTMGWRDERDHVVCLDANTGQKLWTRSYACPSHGRMAIGDKGLYSGVTSTPDFDATTGYLYSLSADGHLNCWDTKTEGKNVWSLNLYDEFPVERRPKVGRSSLKDYGYSSSPLVFDDTVIVEVGSSDGNLMGFDKRSGKRRWSSQSKSPAGHTGGPVPITVENIPCAAIQNHDGLLVVRLDREHEGETVATVDWETTYANNVATVSVEGKHVIVTSSYNHQKIAKFEITLQGAKKLWEQKFASKVCTPVIRGGRVYWVWRRMMCLDYETGELKWQGGRFGDAGSLIATADNRLIVWANRGDLLLVDSAKRSPDRYREVDSKKGVGKSDAWPHVVLAGGKLFCKDRNGNLHCFKIGR